MENSCSCAIGDFEPITCHEINNPKAIKEHTCDECGGPIKKGEKYYVHKGLCDGSWFRIKNCDACETIRHDYGCGAIGGLDDVVFECLGIHICQDPNTIDDAPPPRIGMYPTKINAHSSHLMEK